MNVINFFAGPGAGKSTLAAGLFYNLKMKGINVELTTEFAKDLTWEGRKIALGNQPYIFGKQYHKIHRLIGQVDAIITDSPLMLNLLYAKDMKPSFKEYVVDINGGFDNIDFFVQRIKDYNPKGRNQTIEEAIELDNRLMRLVNFHCLEPQFITGDEKGLESATKYVLEKLNVQI